MNLALFIARRYLFSRKQKSVINVISWISLVGIAVCTMALVVVLSVYNGIGQLTQGLFNVLDPELKIEPTRGKSFSTLDIDFAAFQNIEGIESVNAVVEENAWITHGEQEAIVLLRGVDSLYGSITGIDQHVLQGVYVLNGFTTRTDSETALSVVEETNFILLGAEIFYNLNVRLLANTPIAIHIPKRNAALGMSLDDAFNSAYVMPSGAFFLQQDIDSRYAIADINLVRRLLDYDSSRCTFLAVKLDGSRSAEAVKQDVQQQLGNQYAVLDRFEQQPLYYKIFRSERLGIILILALITLISTLNLVASLTLLILDKKHDIAILRSMGMPPEVVRRAFFLEGLLISGVGIVAGLLLGFILCFVQEHFGIITMGDNFIVHAFPVAMRGVDFLVTTLTVGVISTLAVFLATRRKHSLHDVKL